MLNLNELIELHRSLRGEKVLSVYLNGTAHDFSERDLWRRRLDHELVDLRRQLEESHPEEVEPFSAAVAHVQGALEGFVHFLPGRGWVGFATADRFVQGHPLRVPMPDLARWELGARVAPYVRALKQDRVVVAVLVDSRRVRVFEYHDGSLTEPDSLRAETFLGDLTDVSVSKRATGHSGVRGETATDAAQRLLDVGSERMLKRVVDLVSERVGRDGLLVVGGTHEAGSALLNLLPASLRSRATERPSLTVDMSLAQLQGPVETAASELTQGLQAELLAEVIDQAKSGQKGALGPVDVEEALRAGQVDTLLLTRGFIQGNPDYADSLVGLALDFHGEIEELSVDGGRRLDHEGAGVAARLRYA